MASPTALDTEVRARLTQPISVFPFEPGRTPEPALARIATLEADRTPADARHAALEAAWHGARAQLEALADALYEPHCRAIHEQLVHPGLGVPTVAVDGTCAAHHRS